MRPIATLPKSRARAWRRASAITAAGAASATGALLRARHHAPYAPVLERVDIGAAAWTGAHPLRIGFVTDTHVGPVIRPSDVARALDLLFAARPDLLLLGGDYVCESPRHIEQAAAMFGEYAALAPMGAFAVLGNHDYSNDARRLMRHLESRAIRVLRNEAVRVGVGGHHLWIVGVDDVMLGSPDPDSAFAEVAGGDAAIVLWHEPDWAERIAPFGPMLQLSGHSHGGQLRFPVVGSIAAPAGGRRFVSGLSLAGGIPVYTSRGVGAYRPPIRIACPPEVTLVTLSGYDATD